MPTHAGSLSGSFGHFIGGLARHASRQPLDRCLTTEIAGQLEPDAYVGLQGAQMDRVATVYLEILLWSEARPVGAVQFKGMETP